MRIVSSHHDYYDCIQRYGQEDDCVYVRSPVEVFIPKSNPNGKSVAAIPFSPVVDRFATYFYNRNNRPFSYIDCDSGVIGFCGKLYPYIQITDSSNRSNPIGTKVCWSTKDICDQVAKLGIDIPWRNNSKGMKPIINWFNSVANTDWSEGFIAQGSPLFTMEPHFSKKGVGHILTWNGNLKEKGFQRVKDTQTCFQEIHSYLSGVLGNGNPTVPEMDNQTRIDSHGFDKWSFRKKPK